MSKLFSLKAAFLPTYLTGLIQKNEKLRKTVRSAASLDSARAKQANEQTRDCMFTKLYNYVILMHELNLCKEKTYCEFKSNCIYNMDECTLDTTKTSKKMFVHKKGIKRLFIITPKGDGKMKLHISLAFTTRADGESSLKYVFFCH